MLSGISRIVITNVPRRGVPPALPPARATGCCRASHPVPRVSGSRPCWNLVFLSVPSGLGREADFRLSSFPTSFTWSSSLLGPAGSSAFPHAFPRVCPPFPRSLALSHHCSGTPGSALQDTLRSVLKDGGMSVWKVPLNWIFSFTGIYPVIIMKQCRVRAVSCLGLWPAPKQADSFSSLSFPLCP